MSFQPFSGRLQKNCLKDVSTISTSCWKAVSQHIMSLFSVWTNVSTSCCQLHSDCRPSPLYYFACGANTQSFSCLSFSRAFEQRWHADMHTTTREHQSARPLQRDLMLTIKRLKGRRLTIWRRRCGPGSVSAAAPRCCTAPPQRRWSRRSRRWAAGRGWSGSHVHGSHTWSALRLGNKMKVKLDKHSERKPCTFLF